MADLSTMEIVIEAQKLHPDIPKSLVDLVHKFLVSDLNKEELKPSEVKDITEAFLKHEVKEGKK